MSWKCRLYWKKKKKKVKSWFNILHCFNNNEKVIAENDSYSLIFNPDPDPDPNPYESLKNLFTESLYDKKISITEATDEELKSLKDEIDTQMKDILN